MGVAATLPELSEWTLHLIPWFANDVIKVTITKMNGNESQIFLICEAAFLASLPNFK